jgi:hypothetical protein
LNRLLRINNVIKGDDDIITTFSDTQHASDIELGQISIQDELNDLISDHFIGYEDAQTSFTSVASTTTYALATDFIRFIGKKPFLYDSTNNVQIFEYHGGKDSLRHFVLDYATVTGDPHWWYIEPDTTKKISLYPTPDSSNASKVYTYDYEKDVSVTDSTDTLPFTNTITYQSFISMAARRFFFMLSEQPLGDLNKDATYSSAKSRLVSLMRHKNPPNRYGRKH